MPRLNAFFALTILSTIKFLALFRKSSLPTLIVDPDLFENPALAKFIGAISDSFSVHSDFL